MRLKTFLAAAIISVIFSCKPATENQPETKLAAHGPQTKVVLTDDHKAFVECVEIREKSFWEPYSKLTEKYEDCIARNKFYVNYDVCSYVSLTKLDQEKSTFLNHACFNQFKKYITFDQCYLLLSNTNAGPDSRQKLAIKCLENFKGKMDKIQCESLLYFFSDAKDKYQKQCDTI